MSADKFPFYPWFPRDYAADEHVQVMTLAAEGAYRRLLDHQWLHGSIPADPAVCARLCRAGAEEFTALWPLVAPCFHPIEGDPSRLQNRKLERIRAETVARREALKAAGSRGGSQRAANAASKRDDPLSQPQATLEAGLEPASSDPPSPATIGLQAFSSKPEAKAKAENTTQQQGDDVKLGLSEAQACLAALEGIDLSTIPGDELPEVRRLVALLPVPTQVAALEFFVRVVVGPKTGPSARMALRTALGVLDGCARGLGMPGMRPATWEAIGVACLDLAGEREFNAARFRTFAGRAERGMAPPASASAPESPRKPAQDRAGRREQAAKSFGEAMP